MRPDNETSPVLPLPDALALANLAAHSRFAGLPDKTAVSAALALYREAQWRVEHERKLAEACHAHYVAPLQNLRWPKNWPANFGEFLRCVVPGKDSGEREQHFAEFASAKAGESPEIYGKDKLAAKARLIGEYKATKFTRVIWETVALDFRRYWARRKVEVRREAGRKGAATKTSLLKK